MKITFSSLSPLPCNNLYEVLYLDGLRSFWWTYTHKSADKQEILFDTCFFPSIPILSLKYIMEIQIKNILHWGGVGYRAEDYLQLLLPEPAACIGSG